ANLHWGGPYWRTLFVCASTSLSALDTMVVPRNEPFMRVGAGAGQAVTSQPAVHASARADTAPAASAAAASGATGGLALDPSRCALIIQDMQNDVVMEGGAFAASGSPQHCREQNAIHHARQLAERCRTLGIPVIHVWFKVPPGAPGLTLNAPLFEGVLENNALVEGTWGSEPVPGLEAQPSDFIVRKMRMSAWEGSNLETILKATDRDTLIECGAWTNMSVEHTARTGADKGYLMIIPEDACSTMNADWHRASIEYAMQNVAAVTTTADVLAALGG
ncbi:MAG: cysteine hydrolase, partial [Pseudomonadota bacterium]